MPALNFQKQFAPAVKAGTKKQTIRAFGKRRPFKKGDKLYLFTGMRQKNCERLGEAVCKAVYSIKIYDPKTTNHLSFAVYSDNYIRVFSKLNPDSNQFAKKDGFKNAEEMIQWFKSTHGLPFKGQLIKW